MGFWHVLWLQDWERLKIHALIFTLNNGNLSRSLTYVEPNFSTFKVVLFSNCLANTLSLFFLILLDQESQQVGGDAWHDLALGTTQ